MPRPAADRRFGFQSTGILRILVAADPEEVLKAIEELGIIIEHEHETIPIPTLPNSIAKLEEAESLLQELDLLKRSMDATESQIHRSCRAFSANRTRAQANADVVFMDITDDQYETFSTQYDDFSQILAFILRFFTQNALAWEEEREEERKEREEEFPTTSTI